jgi:hypothetical protein
LVVGLFGCCRDWQLKQEFWDNIVGVCAFIGRENVRKLILPLLDFHQNAHVRAMQWFFCAVTADGVVCDVSSIACLCV